MNRVFYVAAIAAQFSISSPAAAQSVTLEQLAQRVEALERENAVLRQQVARLTAPIAPTVATSPVVYAAPPPAEPTDFWAGPYAGLNVGYAETRYRGSPVVGSPRETAGGPTVGAQLGWRWQSGLLAAGIELEASFPQRQDVTLFSFPFSPARHDTDVAGRAKA